MRKRKKSSNKLRNHCKMLLHHLNSNNSSRGEISRSLLKRKVRRREVEATQMIRDPEQQVVARIYLTWKMVRFQMTLGWISKMMTMRMMMMLSCFKNRFRIRINSRLVNMEMRMTKMMKRLMRMI